MERLAIVIPAAGLGRRMKSLGPKSLLRLGTETILARQLRLLRSLFPAAEVVVVLGFEAERVRRQLPPWVQVVVNEDYCETNVARSVGLGLEAAPPGRALVVYGDLVFNLQALTPFVDLDPSVTAVLVDSEGRFRDCEVGVNVIDHEVQFFCYGLPRKWVHVVHLAVPDREVFQRLALREERSRQFGFEILNALLERETSIRAVEPAGMLATDLDTSRDLGAARGIVAAD